MGKKGLSVTFTVLTPGPNFQVHSPESTVHSPESTVHSPKTVLRMAGRHWLQLGLITVLFSFSLTLGTDQQGMSEAKGNAPSVCITIEWTSWGRGASVHIDFFKALNQCQNRQGIVQ